MKRRVVISLVLVLLLTIMLAGSVSSKGHVPAGKVQVCHKNEMTLEIDALSLQDHLDHGDGQLPACDFSNVFHKGESCPADADGDGFADLANERDSAEGLTPACPPGTY